MKKHIRFLLSPLAGLLYAAAVILLSRLLIVFLAGPAGAVCRIAGLDADTLEYVRQILIQFRNARLVSPWLPALLTGAVCGLLTGWAARRRAGRILCVILWVILLLPLVLTAVWFTSVNDIMTGALIRTLLPLLPALL